MTDATGTGLLPDCPFCAIARRHTPAAVGHEDADTLAFLDIHPVAEGHTLVIPKTHFRTLFDLDDATGAALMQTVRTVAKALRTAGMAEGLNLLQSNEAVGGQDIFHLHFHVIPRKADDGIMARSDQDRVFNWRVLREPRWEELVEVSSVVHGVIRTIS